MKKGLKNYRNYRWEYLGFDAPVAFCVSRKNGKKIIKTETRC